MLSNILKRRWASSRKNTSFGLTHLILNENNELAGIGTDIVVLYDYNTNQKMPIPIDIRNAIHLKEGKIFDTTS